MLKTSLLQSFTNLRCVGQIGSRFISTTTACTSGGATLFVNPDPNVIPKLNTLDILENFAKLTGAEKEYGSPSNVHEALERRRKLMDLLPKTQAELPPRKMEDSFATANVPISQNPHLRERYVTYDGNVRIGRLLEDLDIFAAWCCYRHILNPKGAGHPNPYSVVTALVDTIHFSGDQINPNVDIRLSGHVSYAGRSSMEVSIVIDQQSAPGSWKKLTSAVFVFVARDPLNQGSAIINPLQASSPAEAAYISLGQQRSIKRKLASQESLFLKPPTEEERGIIHNLFMSTLDPSYCGFRPATQTTNQMPPNMSTMEDTRLNTLLLCHPQESLQ